MVLKLLLMLLKIEPTEGKDNLVMVTRVAEVSDS